MLQTRRISIEWAPLYWIELNKWGRLWYLMPLSTIFQFYQTFCTFSFVFKESSLSDTRCLIQDVVSPHCGDKTMARRCTRSSLQDYFVMTSYHWNAGKTRQCEQCKQRMNGKKRDAMHKM